MIGASKKLSMSRVLTKLKKWKMNWLSKKQDSRNKLI